MSFSLIVAADDKRGIGKNGKLPWHLPHDLHRFKLVTQGHTVIMGRKTWESIPEKRRPLPDRLNIVLTHEKQYELSDEVLLAHSLDEALQMTEKKQTSEKIGEKIFIIGGGKLFQEAIHHPDCRDIWYTHVKGDFGCDTFFPEISKSFKKIASSEGFKENDIEFAFEMYRKN